MKKPFFSIVIPTRNRERQLHSCLDAVASLDYPRNRFEVIVIDDGSDTPPVKTIKAFKKKLQLTLIRQKNTGPAAARNAGAEAAKGPFLAFTDDDCRPYPSWLHTLAERFTTSPSCCIGGKSINALPYNYFSAASQLLIDYLFSYYNTVAGRASFLTSNNLAVPKRIFHEIGGFDTSFPNAAAEDREFCDRWLASGYPISFAPEIRIHHAHLLSLRTFWRQHYTYGSNAYRFHRIKAGRSTSGIILEPPSFYLNLLTYPFKTNQGRRSIIIAGLMVVSQTANATGFLIQRIRAAAGLCR